MAWENQYINLVSTRPGVIFPLQNDAVSDDERSAIHSVLKPFPEVFVELGSGSGCHLIERARRNPDGAYLGVELRFKRTFRTAEKAERLGLRNLFLLRTTAQQAPKIFAPHTIAGFYILFPDPWDKRRWKKHRLLSSDFLMALHRLLKPGGFVSYKTDHQEYFEETLALAQQLPAFSVQRCIRGLHQSTAALENVMSEFESLFYSQQAPVYLLELMAEAGL
jgi:tRNA (guanine-N7-)-methyltransferase